MSSMFERWGKVVVKKEGEQTCIASLDPEEIEKRKRARLVESHLKMANSYVNKCNQAKNINREFTLTLEDWIALSSQQFCSYSGEILTSKNRTMERINPYVGYTPENTLAVTNVANCLKSCLDKFVKEDQILPEMKVKLLRKALYQIEKQIKNKG